ATLARITEGREDRNVYDLTLEQIKKFDIGSWFDHTFSGETIPTLEEVLKIAKGTALMIEIKEGLESSEEMVSSILKVLKTTDSNHKFLKFGSFSLPLIQELMKKAPKLNVLGIAEELGNIEGFLDLGLNHIALWYKLIDTDLIHMLHQKGIDVWTFTVDEPEIARFLITLSIQGIITNQPRRMRNHINS
ncbi:MAG: hypothetical protein H0X29_09005, partial [Parachlamydiaceae bacterium]|nr:hypothetical protein [Parachlamydiaceae bacterium]